MEWALKFAEETTQGGWSDWLPLFSAVVLFLLGQGAVIVAFRRHTLLPLDDCLYALQPTIPHLTRSSLHRCLQRHGISRLPDVEGDKPAKKKQKAKT